MPAGCEFICKNQSCECCGQGFNITGAWPMGRIELVLNAPNVKKNADFRKGLIDLKNDGRKYACITYPNDSRIPIVAYRINMWSEKAHCIYQNDVILKDNESLEEAIQRSNIPTVCPKTQCTLLTFDEVLENGILCPKCGIPLQQDRWFAKEE